VVDQAEVSGVREIDVVELVDFHPRRHPAFVPVQVRKDRNADLAAALTPGSGVTDAQLSPGAEVVADVSPDDGARHAIRADRVLVHEDLGALLARWGVGVANNTSD